MSSRAVEKADMNVKILLIGDSNVGKSCILMRFIENKFTELSPTIGVDFKRKLMEIKGKRVRATIWDTAGQERFRTLTSSYYRGAHGIVLVYDVTCQSSFDNIQLWLKECENYCIDQAENIVKLLVANKIDLTNRVVSSKDGQAFAKQHGMLYIETSSKEGIGINQVFEELVTKVLESPVLLESLGVKVPTVNISQINETEEDKSKRRHIPIVERVSDIKKPSVMSLYNQIQSTVKRNMNILPRSDNELYIKHSCGFPSTCVISSRDLFYHLYIVQYSRIVWRIVNKDDSYKIYVVYPDETAIRSRYVSFYDYLELCFDECGDYAICRRFDMLGVITVQPYEIATYAHISNDSNYLPAMKKELEPLGLNDDDKIRMLYLSRCNCFCKPFQGISLRLKKKVLYPFYSKVATGGVVFFQVDNINPQYDKTKNVTINIRNLDSSIQSSIIINFNKPFYCVFEEPGFYIITSSSADNAIYVDIQYGDEKLTQYTKLDEKMTTVIKPIKQYKNGRMKTTDNYRFDLSSCTYQIDPKALNYNEKKGYTYSKGYYELVNVSQHLCSAYLCHFSYNHLENNHTLKSSYYIYFDMPITNRVAEFVQLVKSLETTNELNSQNNNNIIKLNEQDYNKLLLASKQLNGVMIDMQDEWEFEPVNDVPSLTCIYDDPDDKENTKEKHVHQFFIDDKEDMAFLDKLLHTSKTEQNIQAYATNEQEKTISKSKDITQPKVSNTKNSVPSQMTNLLEKAHQIGKCIEMQLGGGPSNKKVDFNRKKNNSEMDIVQTSLSDFSVELEKGVNEEVFVGRPKQGEENNCTALLKWIQKRHEFVYTTNSVYRV